MKKLSKAQVVEMDKLISGIQEAKQGVEEEWAKLEEALGMVNDAVGKYNEALQEFAGFRDEIVGQMENYYDERSEKWQEGDAGQAYGEWKDTWESAGVEEVSEVEIGEVGDMDHADELEGLPTEVEG